MKSSPVMSESKTYIVPDDFTFEQAMERLEAIVRTLEGDGCKLEEALSAHAEGIALARFCMQRLDAAELKVQSLSIE